ncbi:hypothetical protein E9232_001129 [Inquilinus ginsengisoli]|uniref:Tail fiber protein n=1 Tax=Inquilinus ginsengisoli TaxID=363840 RepID=A0ABU1JJ26_9PROT|nr:hypothetical protein [Inquilinus ginsengisoli]MDR6288622.1 hypothetical protein [Inquilinus ginsengisoli]
MAGIFETDLPSVSTIDKIRGTKARSSSNITPTNLANQMAPLMSVIDGDGIVKLLPDWIIALQNASAGGVLGYSTKAQMVAATPTVPATGVMRTVTNDPADSAGSINGTWRYDPAVGGDHWVKSADQVSGLRADVATMQPKVAQAAAANDGVYLATGAPRPIAFADTTSYAQTWVNISTPATRFTITASTAGYQVVGLAGLSSPWPVGIKLPYDLVPGDSYYIEGKYTAGTMTSNSGFFIGTDPTTTGDISTNARLLVRRGTILNPSLANGTSSDGARTVAPAFSAPAFVNDTVVGFQVDVQSDRSLAVKIFQDGGQVSSDVAVTPATSAGAVVIGMMIANGQTAIITKITRRATSGTTLFVHSGVASSGDGTRRAPLKSLTDVNGTIVSQGLVGQPITITNLTDNVYGYLEMKDTLSPRWTLNGLPGGNTALNGFNFAETPTWTVVGSTGGTVWTTPTKHGLDVVSHPNQVFVTNLSWNPRPWYVFPHKALVTRSTANGGVDMAGDTAGSTASQGGQIYLRLPDGLPSADPNAYPTGGYGLVVSRAVSLIKVIGAPEVHLNNLTLRWSSGALFTGGAGFGTINNCVFEWSGYNNPNIQVENGQYTIDGGHSFYSDGDGIGRTPRIDMPFQAGSVLTTKVRNFEIAYTGSQAGASGGDGISDHVLDIVFDASNRSNRLYLENVYIHDCWKCGYVGSDDYLKAHGIRIERCGTEQFAVLGVATANAVGRTQRAIVSDFRFDPQGLGTTGVRTLYTDGMALCELDLTNGWIGTPAAGGRELEALATTLTVAGVPQTRDITDNIIRFTNVRTERDAGSVVKNGDGLATGLLTFSSNPANGDTVTIGAVTYTFNTTLGGGNSIKIGGSALKTRNNLVAAVMADPLQIGDNFGASTVVHPTVTALAAAGNVALKAKTAGTGGNSIVTTKVSTALSFGASTLTGGVAASGTFVPVIGYALA